MRIMTAIGVGRSQVGEGVSVEIKKRYPELTRPKGFSYESENSAPGELSEVVGFLRDLGLRCVPSRSDEKENAFVVYRERIFEDSDFDDVEYLTVHEKACPSGFRVSEGRITLEGDGRAFEKWDAFGIRVGAGSYLALWEDAKNCLEAEEMLGGVFSPIEAPALQGRRGKDRLWCMGSTVRLPPPFRSGAERFFSPGATSYSREEIRDLEPFDVASRVFKQGESVSYYSCLVFSQRLYRRWGKERTGLTFFPVALIDPCAEDPLFQV